MANSFRKRFLQAESRKSAVVSDLLHGAYDLMVLTASWDARCLAITKAGALKCDSTVLLLFNGRDKVGLRDLHDPILQRFAAASSRHAYHVTGDSANVTDIWAKLAECIFTVRKRVGRPLRILLDLSTCPRYYSLGVISSTFACHAAAEVMVFYSEGTYESSPGADIVSFTEGGWSTVAVPNLVGEFVSGRPSLYVVSAGFEGEKTWRAVSRSDPDQTVVLFAKPGFSAAYERRSSTENRRLLEDFAVSKRQRLYAAAGDAVAAWKVLDAYESAKRTPTNTFYMTCGTKPHALAMALSAVAYGHPAVLYNIPDLHCVHRTCSNGTFWSYRITDTTSV